MTHSQLKGNLPLDWTWGWRSFKPPWTTWNNFCHCWTLLGGEFEGLIAVMLVAAASKKSLSLSLCLVGASSNTKCTEAQRRVGVGELKLHQPIRDGAVLQRWPSTHHDVLRRLRFFRSPPLIPKVKACCCYRPGHEWQEPCWGAGYCGMYDALDLEISCWWQGSWFDEPPFLILGWLMMVKCYIKSSKLVYHVKILWESLQAWAHSKASILQGPSSKAGEPFAASR